MRLHFSVQAAKPKEFACSPEYQTFLFHQGPGGSAWGTRKGSMKDKSSAPVWQSSPSRGAESLTFC